MNEFLFVVVPYLCLTTFVVGHLWRYRYDKFGWTTRSSQLYESRLLRVGSPLFHFGIIGVFFGHVVGLGIPKSWTGAVGVSEGLYHFLAVTVGVLKQPGLSLKVSETKVKVSPEAGSQARRRLPRSFTFSGGSHLTGGVAVVFRWTLMLLMTNSPWRLQRSARLRKAA